MDSYPLDKFQNKAIIVNPSNYFSVDLVSIPKDSKKYLEKVILPQGMIVDRIEQLAKDIIDTNPGKSLTFLVIMKSALTYANYLQKFFIDFKKSNDTCHYFYEYVTVSSYEDDKSTGHIVIKTNEKVFEELKGKDVVIVEDMYDSGKTMDHLLKYLQKFQPSSVQIACLFLKQNVANLVYNLDIKYLGFVIPKDTFIIGFGMDFNEVFRDLNHSCLLSKEGYKMLTEGK